MIKAGLILAISGVSFSITAAPIGYDQVQPFPQSDPISVSEKVAVKFKPNLRVDSGCVPFTAVNAAGDTNEGLSVFGGTPCWPSLWASQVYGRSQWFNDVYAVMYSWYFPKGIWDKHPLWRHDWSSAVFWIDNPAVENPNILAISLSKANSKYHNEVPVTFLNATKLTFVRSLPAFSSAKLEVTLDTNAQTQDLIMWDQLTDAARAALNDDDNFGRADVPFSDDNFPKWLGKAWPFEN